MILDTISKTIQIVLGAAVATNQLPCVASWADMSGSTFTAGASDALTNGTTAVTLVGSPASGYQRQIKSVSVYNADTASATVQVLYYNGTTTRTVVDITLQVGETLQFGGDNTWSVINNSGQVQ
jgi:hypothetical protein